MLIIKKDKLSLLPFMLVPQIRFLDVSIPDYTQDKWEVAQLSCQLPMNKYMLSSYVYLC